MTRNLVVVPDVTTDYAESHNPNGTPNPITLAMLVPDDFWRAYLSSTNDSDPTSKHRRRAALNASRTA